MIDLPPFRPPSEAYSLLIRVTRNCPWNKCAFCGMYKNENFQKRKVEEIKQDIVKLRQFVDRVKEVAWRRGYAGDIRRVAIENEITFLYEGEVKTAFIGDSDSLVVKTDKLEEIIKYLKLQFDSIIRITSYARAKTIFKKEREELIRLKEAGLNRLHIGLETGSDKLLQYINKGVTKDEVIEAAKKVKDAGMELSLYIILGLGGKHWWQEHAIETAKVLNEIEPDFIRVRTLFVLPNTLLYEKNKTGEFVLQNVKELLEEEKLLIENLNCNSLFLSDHISNYLNIEGNIKERKDFMIGEINRILQNEDNSRLCRANLRIIY